MEFAGYLTALVRIDRLAMSAIAGVRLISSARERGLRADILEQLAHSGQSKYCVSHGGKDRVHTPFISVRYFIGMSSLLVDVSGSSSADYVEALYRNLYIWVCFHHPRAPIASENRAKGEAN